MRSLLSLRVLTLLSCAAFLLGCPKKKTDDGADAAAEASAEVPAPVDDAAAAPAPVVVEAKNKADVARFPAETAITDDDAKLATVAAARVAPKTGAVVATLKPASDVNKIAEYQGSILVTFADPKDASATLMGWISKDAFTPFVPKVTRDGGAVAVVDAGAVVVVDAGGGGGKKTLTCPLGMAAVVLIKDPICRRKCAKDADCKGGAAGTCANATTAAGGVARVCTVD